VGFGGGASRACTGTPSILMVRRILRNRCPSRPRRGHWLRTSSTSSAASVVAAHLHKQGIRYTSPTQLTPKAARDSFKVGRIRLPGVSPFRLTRKAQRVHQATKMPQWTIRRVEPYGVMDVVALDVDSRSGTLLLDAFVPVAPASSLRAADAA
jgi:hypothetical protein